MNAVLNLPLAKALASPGETALSLLGASPFLWVDDGDKIRFQWENDEFAAALFCGRPDDLPLTNAAFLKRLCDDAVSARNQAMQSLTWNGARYQIDYQLRTFDGRNIWVEERGMRREGDGAKPTQISGVISNIQSRKIKEEQAGYHASFDSLTGLWNKSRMAEALTQMLAFAQRYDRQAAYLLLRVSNISDINVTYGYEAGDRLLAAIAKRLTACVRSPDVCARVSGLSFGIGLADCSGAQMIKVAERIVRELSDTPYGSPYGELYTEFAVGGSALSQKAVSAADAMEQAATASRHSKLRQGAFVAYDQSLPDLRPRQRARAVTRDDVITALNDRRVTLAYQPIVHAGSRETHHYECLLRLRRDDGEMISAADFIQAAERLDCVHLLDRRALEIAHKTLMDKPEIRLALNVSAATVINPETADAYLETLRALGPLTKNIVIELTETVALEDPAMASRFSVEARSFGCQFAIDDFGAGYTTFRNLMAIEADEIKIDGSFIRDLSLTPHKQVFVRMMVDLAQTFSVKTVAEMVGSREDADLLTRLGVDYLQGFMFGVPAPAPGSRAVLATG